MPTHCVAWGSSHGHRRPLPAEMAVFLLREHAHPRRRVLAWRPEWGLWFVRATERGRLAPTGNVTTMAVAGY